MRNVNTWFYPKEVLGEMAEVMLQIWGCVPKVKGLESGRILLHMSVFRIFSSVYRHATSAHYTSADRRTDDMLLMQL